MANHDIYKAIVRITNTSPQENQDSLGSGVIFTPTGLVITNNHVIEDSDFGTAFGQITVESLQTVDQPAANPVAAELIIRNEEYDLAVLKLASSAPTHFIDLLRAPETDTSLMECRLRVLGYPPLGGATITVTRGIVSGFDEAGNIKTDAEVNPGNSGGAVLDEENNFLGIPTFIVTESQGKLALVISLKRIKDWLGIVFKSGVPTDTEQLANSFVDLNLNFADGNLDQSTKYPRILGKFAAVELLLAKGEYQNVIPQIEFILSKRPRSALAYHYLGNAFLGLGYYLEAATQYRISLAYDSRRIPALGNLGIALVHLGRHSEALQIFEQITDTSDNPAERRTAYQSMAQIYDIWNQPTVAAQYRQELDALSAQAAERLSLYTHHCDPTDKIAAISNAIVNTEIELDDSLE